MVLEATFLCVDNSDFMRNGDFAPSRMEAQQDAVNLLAGAKTQQNPESTVGVLTMAGRGVEVRVALTPDVGQVLSLSHGAKLGGEMSLSTGIQVAQLALKHRQNKNQRQRIIVFVGSPIKEANDVLVKLGKKLKKNSVAVDIINFGEEAENTPKLEALLNAVNSDDNSHLVTVPPGPHVLSDILLSSPIVQGEDGGGGAAAATGNAGAGAGGGDGFAEFGVDPTLDPEFAWALRASMEEERQRQEREAQKHAEEAQAAGSEGTADAPRVDPAAPADTAGESTAAAPVAPHGGDEATLLEAALAMSMPGSVGLATPTPAPPPTTPGAPMAMAAGSAPVESTPLESVDASAAIGADVISGAPEAAAPADVEMEEVDDDEDMQLALAMSMSQAQKPVAPTPAPEAPADLSAMFQDASFVQSVLGSLPGVDPNDPRIQSVLKALPESEEDGKAKKDEPSKD